MTPRTYVLGIALGVAAALSPALPGRAIAATLELDAIATVSRGVAPSVPVWREYVVRVRNLSAAAKRGTVELIERHGPSDETLGSRTAFAVEPRGNATVRTIILRDRVDPWPIVARLRDENGTVVAEAQTDAEDLHGIVVFDLEASGRLRAMLQGAELPLSHAALRYDQARSIIVTNPPKSQATGLPYVPALPAGYADVTLVFAPTSVLARLSATELRSLGDWVLSGGALAISVDTVADLGMSPFPEWLGGAPLDAPPPSELLAGRNFATISPPEADTLGEKPLALTHLAPTAAVREALHGFRGAGIHNSAWGSTASYGLGEIHLLAFNPTVSPFLTDPWVLRELETLVTRAFARRGHVAQPHGRPRETGSDGVRRALDPNQSMRWPLLAAVGVLLVYAILAGPINFGRAAARGRPLAAIPRLLVAAASVSLLIVALGILSRGTRSRARHVTLVEIGAGIQRGAATRFRGFYTSRAQELRVAASSSRAVLAAVSDAPPTPRLEVDPRGLALANLRTAAWQATVVRDDGFINLGAGIALVRSPEERVVAINRSGRDLVGVVIKQPDDETLYFHAELRDGERVIASEGHRLASTIVRTKVDLSRPTSLLGVGEFSDHLERIEPGTTEAWQALDAMTGDVDWWPQDVPVLLGQLKGGEGSAADSGMVLESDRVLVRVIGYGGAE